MTHDERVHALERLGYSAREAGFLVLAALHSGYFLARQVNRFFRSAPGHVEATLTAKLRARHHATATIGAHGAAVYHLAAKPLYDALGEPDNRHRRRRPPLGIKTKVMALDYVLARPTTTFLSTEAERYAFCTERLSLDPVCLPRKAYRGIDGSTTVRYFVDKFPMAVVRGTPATSPRLAFTYVDGGAQTVDGLDTHLQQYASLFDALPAAEVIAVSDAARRLADAERLFARFVASRARGARVPPDARLEEYFHLRRLFETQQLALFDRAKLDTFRALRRRFRGPDIEAAFARWTPSGHASPPPPPVSAALPTRRPDLRFETCLMKEPYDVFGTLWRAAE